MLTAAVLSVVCVLSGRHAECSPAPDLLTLAREYAARRSAGAFHALMAPGATPNSPDSTATSTVQGVAPYWRAFAQQTWNGQTAMLGTFGMSAKLFLVGVAGAIDRYGDAAVDAQDERRLGAEYVAYSVFDGSTQIYDGAGRRARENNTLYLFGWLVF